jgi:proteasome lid subunit RPN8/RPN11
VCGNKLFIKIEKALLTEILSFAKNRHPLESILLLRGEIRKENMLLTEYLFPPYGRGGIGSASFPVHVLPMDFSILGTAHSHPDGTLRLSITDLHNFYGRIMLLIASPYDIGDVAVFDRTGKRLPLKIIE